MSLYPCTDEEWETLPHVMLTSEKDWDPTSIDCKVQLDNEEWFDAQNYFTDGPDSKIFNEHGEHMKILNIMSYTSLIQKLSKKTP